MSRPRGRPLGSTAPPETLKQRINVTLDEKRQEIARRAGAGNLSAGLRTALDFWNKKTSSPAA
jgi:hypothetical protein